MSEPTSSRSHLRRAIGALLGTAWVGVGLLVGWFVGYLADQLALPAHHLLIYAALGLCGAVLIAWAFGTRLLYLEIRAGLDEASGQGASRRRTGYAWTATLAGPIVGLLIGMSSQSLAHGAVGPRSSPRAEAAATPRAVKAASAALGGVPAAHYVVRPGATLTGIAERLYDAPEDWARIAAVNSAGAGVRQGSAASLLDPSLLTPGMQLQLPRAATSDGGEDSEGGASEATVARTASPVRAIEIFSVLSGFGMIGCALLARRLAKLRRYQSMRSPAGGRPPQLGPADAAIEAELRPLRAAELPEWIDAANRLLCASLINAGLSKDGMSKDGTLDPPAVSLVRAGPLGVELLLDQPSMAAPEGFVAAEGGRTWRLDPSLSLAELRAAAGDAQPYLAVLVPVAEDADGSYLVACGPGESLSVRGSEDEMRRGLGAIWAHLTHAPWGEICFFKVGAASFPGSEQLSELSVEVVGGLAEGMQRAPLWRAGLPDAQPVVIVEDPGLADEVRAAAPGIVAVVGTMLEADRLLWYEEGNVTIEPLGLTLPALLPSAGELAAVARIAAAASATPSVPLEDLSKLPAPSADLPAAGPVEVRLLRPVPDLVGDVDEAKVHPEVVQVVAYLALHNYKATTNKLRDVFGRYKREESRATRTIWNATSHTRNVLGPERFPPALGGKPYTLDTSVTCDWLRLRQIAAIGRSLEMAGHAAEAIEALRVGLELIGDGPPCSDPSVTVRYNWLDAEQLDIELETAVVRAAYSMATLSITHRPNPRSLEDAAWAIERGRVISPEALPLREAALHLAAAQQDMAALDSEFFAAIDAADDLELGEEVDPGLEALYQRLGRGADGALRPPRARVSLA
ncbi:MAG TPA: LysM domain-containing protein [Acidimicrobiales bacterium]|nr:LysM domain-containing protein [Acidimicrobiales bacterium]